MLMLPPLEFVIFQIITESLPDNTIVPQFDHEGRLEHLDTVRAFLWTALFRSQDEAY